MGSTLFMVVPEKRLSLDKPSHSLKAYCLISAVYIVAISKNFIRAIDRRNNAIMILLSTEHSLKMLACASYLISIRSNCAIERNPMSIVKLSPDEPLPMTKAFRHLLVFQVKLIADALRDLFLSPISLVVFFIDALARPLLKDSLTLKLMLAGRRTDRVINLFNEHTTDGEFTIDTSMAELETVIHREIKKKQNE